MSAFGDLGASGEQVKGGVDVLEARKNREQVQVQIRKQKKQDRLRQRRRVVEPQIAGGNDGTSLQAINPKNIPLYVDGVMSDNPVRNAEATKNFRKLLSIERNPPIQNVIEAGVVHKFVDFLGREAFPALQFEAAWALTNIASGTTDHTKAVIEAGAIPIFVKLLSSNSADVREQAVWALGNIAGDSSDCRDLVLNADALPSLLNQIHKQSKVSMLRNATWTLSNFCRGKPAPDFAKVRPALPKLAELIYTEDTEVLTDACWALSYLSDGSNENIQAVIEAGVPSRCIELLMHPDVSVKTPALRTVGNIVTGDDVQTQVIVTNGALVSLLALLGNDRKGIRKEACWTISNITAGNKQQIKAVIDTNIIPVLIDLLEKEEFDIKKEAAWAISNATSGGTQEHIKVLVDHGCIPPFCKLLKEKDEAKIIVVALEGLENILKVGAHLGDENPFALQIEECDGKATIEDLLSHKDDKTRQKAQKIYQTFFDYDDEDEMAVPTHDANQFNFGGNMTQWPQSGGQQGGGGGYNFSQMGN